jgi:hypothetical protein
VRFGLRPARKPSAEWMGLSSFAFPAYDHPSKRNNGARWGPRMNRWASFCRPTMWDSTVVGSGRDQWSVVDSQLSMNVKRPTLPTKCSVS